MLVYLRVKTEALWLPSFDQWPVDVQFFGFVSFVFSTELLNLECNLVRHCLFGFHWLIFWVWFIVLLQFIALAVQIICRSFIVNLVFTWFYLSFLHCSFCVHYTCCSLKYLNHLMAFDRKDRFLVGWFVKKLSAVQWLSGPWLHFSTHNGAWRCNYRRRQA